jgi:Holliday junction resolvase RusA-like endonuclease
MPVGYPVSKPDVDNIAKTVLDGLTGTAYDDDSQVFSLAIERQWDVCDKLVIYLRKFSLN